MDNFVVNISNILISTYTHKKPLLHSLYNSIFDSNDIIPNI